jgi:hypothetical protein
MHFIRAPSFDSTNYILHLILYYVYPVTCNVCIEISNIAVYNQPQVSKLIQIRNATLIDIPAPIFVINLSMYLTTLFIILNETFF